MDNNEPPSEYTDMGKAKKTASRTRKKPRCEFSDIARLTGMTAFAAKTGTSSDAVLAVVCFLLCGTAGNEAWLGNFKRGWPLAKLDILVPAQSPALRRLIDQFVSRVRLINRTLSANMGRFSPEIVAVMLHGSFAGGRSAKNASPQATEKAMGLHRLALDRTAGGQDSLTQDLAPDVEAHNIESTLHPEFLIENTKCRDLFDALERCHQRSAIVVCPKLESSRGGAGPVKDFRRLMELLEGAAPPKNSASLGRTSCLPLKAHAVLAAGGDDLAVMSEAVAGMPERFLWLSEKKEGKPPVPTEPRSADAEGVGSVESLMTAFQGAILTILGARRDGGTPAICFESDNALVAYETGMANHEQWIQTMAEDPTAEFGPVACELPSTLYWGLGFLCQNLPERIRPCAEELLAAAFAAAKRLGEVHFRELKIFRNADLVRQRLVLAGRIMEEVETRAPLGMRDLVRSFNRQRKERHLTVINALIKLKVLVRDEDGRFIQGDVDLSEVEKEFAGIVAVRPRNEV